MKKRILRLITMSLVLLSMCIVGVLAENGTSSQNTSQTGDITETTENRNDNNIYSFDNVEDNEEIKEKVSSLSNNPVDFVANLQGIQFKDEHQIAGAPYTLKSGDAVPALFTFALSFDESIPDYALALRIKTLKDNVISTPSNDYLYKYGGENNPTEEAAQNDAYKYLWIYFTGIEKESEQITISPSTYIWLKPFNTGITNHGDESIVEATVFNLSKDQPEAVSETVKNSLFAEVDQFDWKDLSVSRTPSSRNTDPSNYTIGDIRYEFSTNSNLDSNVLGKGNAESVKVTSTFLIPTENVNGKEEPLIILDKSNFYDNEGNHIPANNITFSTNEDGKPIFTIVQTITNQNIDNELTNPKAIFFIKNATVNQGVPSIIEINQSIQGKSTNFSLSLLSTNVEIKSAVKLNDDFENDTIIKRKENYNNGQAVIISYSKPAGETGNESYLTPKKIINTIGGINVNAAHPTTVSGFVGDKIVYELGAERFVNKQSSPFKILKYTELADPDDGFDITKIEPIEINLGSVNNFSEGTIKLTITLNNGSPIVNTYVPGDAFSKVELTQAQRGQVKSIEVTYENVNPGFTITKGPQITFKVLDQNTQLANGTRVENKMKMYADSGLSTPQSKEAIASFRYQSKPIDNTGVYSNNKYGYNLAKSTETNFSNALPGANTSVLFVVKIENFESDPLTLNSLIDTYNADYVIPYDGNKVALNSSTEINSKFLNDTNKYNINFWSENPFNTDATSDILNVNSIIEDNVGEMEIEFDEITIPGNSVGYITYTMMTTPQMTTQNTIVNEFVTLNNGNPQADGILIWGPVTTYSQYTSKTHYNLSGYTKENNKAITAVEPYSNDVVLFKVRIKNGTENTWNNIVAIDSYNDKYEIHSGENNINPDLLDGLNQTLDFTAKANFTVVGASNEDFDLDNINVSFDDNKRQIIMEFGDNELAEGEYVDVVYTLKVINNANSNDELINDIEVFSNTESADLYRDTWKVNVSQNSYGLLNMAKSASNDNNGINGLLNGDKVNYEVTLQNIHVRKDYYLDLKTIIDTLPDNIEVDVDSIEFTYIQTIDGEDSEIPMPAGWTTPLVTKENNKLIVDFDNEFNLTSSSYNQQFGEITKYRLVMKYSATINTDNPELGSSVSVTRKNDVKAFFLNEHTKIKTGNPTAGNVQINSNINDDTVNDYDDNPLTLSYYGTSANVTVLNDKMNFGELYISRTPNSEYNVSTMSQPFETTATLENYGRKDFEVERFVIILPHGETIQGNTVQIIYPTTPQETQEVPFTTSTYYDEDGLERQRIIVEGPFTINASTSSAKANTLVKFNSVVDNEGILNKMRKSSVNKFSSDIKIGYYLPEGETIKNARGTEETNIYSDWDGDDATTHHYGKISIQKYGTSEIVPYVRLQNEIINIPVGGNEIYSPYNPISDFIAPNDYFAMNITIGSSNYTSASPLEAGTKVVLILQKGARYVSYGFDANGELEDYSFLGEPEITYDSDDNQIITWELTENISRSNNKQFRIRIKTENDMYTSYRQEVLVIPKNEGTQVFYNSTLTSTNEYKNYKYLIRNENISHYLPEYSGPVKFISTSGYVDVFGVLGITALQTATDLETNQQVSSRDTNIYLKLTNKENIIRYNLTIASLKQESKFEDITIINRLASINDLTPYTNKSRNSETNIRLVDEGNMVVTLKENSTDPGTQLSDDDYVVYYFFGGGDEYFTKNDYYSAREEGRWLTKEDVLDSDYDFNDATAFKVKVSSDIKINGLNQINVSFDAKLNEYYIGGLKGMNSYGFNVKVPQGQFSLFSEVSKLSTSADIILDRITINKALIDESVDPLRKEFEFEVKGYNTFDELVYEHPETVKVTVKQNEDGTWSGTTNLYELPYGLRYEVTEIQEVNFKEPVVEFETIENTDNTTEWIYNFTNERIVKEITVNTHWKNSKGEDLNISNLPGIEARLHVIKDSTTRELKSPLSSIQMDLDNNWQGSFGSFSLYEEELNADNEKVLIKYMIEADDVTGYTKSITFDEENYMFDIVYVQNPGAVRVINTDVFENRLNGGTFGLYNELDELVTEFTISSNGEITIEDIDVGNYTIKQLVAPKGFNLNKNTYPFIIELDQQEQAVVYVINHKTPSNDENNKPGEEDKKPDNGSTENDRHPEKDGSSSDSKLPQTGINNNKIKIYSGIVIVGMILLIIGMKKKNINEELE